jgi:hypothetical protein
MSERRPEPDKPTLSSELKGTEALLAALRPTAPTIDRDRVMYEAGLAAGARASTLSSGMVSRGVVIRRATTFAALAATLLLGMQIGARRTHEVEQQVAVSPLKPAEAVQAIDVASSPMETQPAKLPGNSYGELRKHLATAASDLPSPAGERRDSASDADAWRHRSSELLRALNSATDS